MAKREVNNMEVKKNNRNRIFRYILRSGQISNPDIAYALKISLPTVTQNTKELLERGLVQEMGELQSTGGRRAKALAAAADFRLAVGLDITQNHIGLLLTNLKGEILKYERLQLTYCAKDRYYQEINARLERFLEESSQKDVKEKILGIGISFPGIVNPEQKMITYSHVLRERHLPLEKVSRFFDYPCVFLNDANAGAYAEGIQGDRQERFFYLSLSNTVGGAVFDSRQLTQGENFRCGEVGHMTIIPEGEQCYCGKAGCLDVYCSAKKLADLADGKLELFFEALNRGETQAVSAWETYTSYLAMAVNNIHMILDCDVILGGYVGSWAEPYLAGIQRKVSARNTFEEDGTYVRACRYKVGAAALGAAMQVIEAYIEQV